MARSPLLIGLVLLLAAGGGFTYHGRRAGKPLALSFPRIRLPSFSLTPLLSLRARFSPAAAKSSATAQVVAKGSVRLAEASFSSAREALASAAQLLRAAPKDEEAKAFFVLCAAELKLSYGQVGADWDQARRVVGEITEDGPSQLRARGAFALAAGDAARAKSLLASIFDPKKADLETSWLYAQSLARTGEAARAAQVLDAAIQREPTAKLMLSRALVARDQGTLEEAGRFFDKTLEKAPGNGRALVELADVKLAQGDLAAAGRLVDKVLGPEILKTLDAAEEARASTIKGKLLAAQHDSKGAEVAFERAVVLDPGSGSIHAAYGAFRLRRREWEKAARQLEAALADAPRPEVMADAARAYLGVNRWVEADKQATAAVAKDPSNPHFLYVQGKVAEALGKPEEALKIYDKALEKKPDLIEALVAKGLIAIARGNQEAAGEAAARGAKAPAAGRTALDEEGLGELFLQIGEAQKAVIEFSAARQLDPEDPQAHAGLGRALAARRDFAGARVALEAALKLTDGDAALWYEYGSLLRQMKESDAALPALERAVKLDGKDARFQARLGALLVERGELAKAEEQLRSATLNNDRLGEAWFFLARAQAGQKKLAEAIDTAKRAIELEPDNALFLYHLGLIYEQGQQVSGAVESFRKSLARNPANADADQHLGQNLMVENRYTEAVEAFQQGTRVDPSRATLWAQLGDARQQAGDLDAAIADLGRALRLDPHLAFAWTKLGIAYKDKGCADCKERAIEALRKAALADAKDPVAFHELGYLYKDEGRRKEAIAAFRRYLELRPAAVDAETVKDDIYYLQEESRRTP